MARYVLTGGTYAFIHGNRVNVGEEFTLPDDEKPPKFSRKLEDGEVAKPVEVTPEPNPTMHEIQVGDKTKARPSDDEPISE